MRYRKCIKGVVILMAMCVLLSGCGNTKKSKKSAKTARISMSSSETVNGAEEEDIDISAILATTNRKITSSGLEADGTTAATSAKPTSATTSAPTQATRAATASATEAPAVTEAPTVTEAASLIARIEPISGIIVAQAETEPVTEASTEAAAEEPTEASVEEQEVAEAQEDTTAGAVMEVAGEVPSDEAETENIYSEPCVFTNGYQTAVEQRIEELINEERVANGLAALVHNSSLYSYSQSRCIDIMTNFSHDGNDSEHYGENIHMNSGYNFKSVEEVAQFIYQAWYDSSSHHINYLRSMYVSSCVAIYYVDGAFYAVHTFALY